MQQRKALGFTIALFILPLLAWLKPEIGASYGFIHAELINQICVMLIFFLNGLSLNPLSVLQSAKNFKLNLLIQLFCFSLIPYLIFLASRTVFPLSGLYHPFIVGAIIMSTIPITTTSCVIFTAQVKGDDKAALFNAILSNFVGVFTAPIALTFLLGLNGFSINFEPWSIMLKLLILTIIPLVLGQFLGPLIKSWFNQNSYLRASEVLLLFIVYSAFCDSFQQIKHLESPAEQISLLILWMGFFHLAFLGLAYLAGKIFRFPSDQRKTILFTAPQKTVAVGIPLNLAIIASAALPNMQAEAAFYMLPLLIYNNIQWLTAGLLVYLISRSRISEKS